MNVNKHRFLILDIFRGLAALLVVLFHFSKNFNDLQNVSIIQNGHRFVDFFFVLSGFIIFYNYNNIKSFYDQKQFMVKRLLRIYPLHFVMLIVFVLFETSKFLLARFGLFNSPAFGNSNLSSFIQNLFLLQAFVKSEANLSWNYPSWSISSEMVAYVVFVLTIVPINLYAKKFRVPVLLLISLIGLIIFTQKVYPYVSRCIYGFFLGCVTYYLFNFFQTYILKLKVLYNSIIEFIAIVVVVIFTSYVKWEPFVGYLLPVIYAIVIIIFACERGWLSKRLTGSALLNNTGTYSYSIYMVHALLAVITHIIVDKILKIHSAVVKDLMVIPFLVAVYYTSSFTYKHVEIGGKSVMKKLFRL